MCSNRRHGTCFSMTIWLTTVCLTPDPLLFQMIQNVENLPVTCRKTVSTGSESRITCKVTAHWYMTGIGDENFFSSLILSGKCLANSTCLARNVTYLKLTMLLLCYPSTIPVVWSFHFHSNLPHSSQCLWILLSEYILHLIYS